MLSTFLNFNNFFTGFLNLWNQHFQTVG